jgi:hypothetical protein
VLHLPANPTCGVVIEKNDEGETICGAPAAQLVSMVDPETKSKVSAMLLVCERHDAELEAGKSLIFVGENGEHIGVTYKTKEE